MLNVREVLKDHLGSFNAVINMFTSLGYYGEEDEKVLGQLWDLSAPGGVLVIDVANRDWIVRHFIPRDYYEHAGGVVNVVARRLVLENSEIVATYEYYERRGEDLRHRATVRMSLRLYSLHELINLIERTGWRYIRSFGDFDLNPCTIDSNRIILVAKKPDSGGSTIERRMKEAPEGH
ncbi:hypothetical protein CW700_04060 [Candidatus Bathyarchaeota archaeon]|nr:MAG: hypothetical protein CW700_04060 [Candidatus Bathyarchaeota archaeon]